MALTVAEAVETWAKRWTALKAWNRPLEEATFELRKQRARDRFAGRACVVSRTIELNWVPDNMPENLRVVLHELAHLAAPGDDNHSPRWARFYADAVLEVTGIAIVADAQPMGHYREDYMGNGASRDIDNAACEAVKTWWKRSGNDRIFKLATGVGLRLGV